MKQKIQFAMVKDANGGMYKSRKTHNRRITHKITVAQEELNRSSKQIMEASGKPREKFLKDTAEHMQARQTVRHILDRMHIKKDRAE